jgi:hypothetical protein
MSTIKKELRLFVICWVPVLAFVGAAIASRSTVMACIFCFFAFVVIFEVTNNRGKLNTTKQESHVIIDLLCGIVVTALFFYFGFYASSIASAALTIVDVTIRKPISTEDSETNVN